VLQQDMLRRNKQSWIASEEILDSWVQHGEHFVLMRAEHPRQGVGVMVIRSPLDDPSDVSRWFIRVSPDEILFDPSKGRVL
jgi:hypothetical protein